MRKTVWLTVTVGMYMISIVLSYMYFKKKLVAMTKYKYDTRLRNIDH